MPCTTLVQTAKANGLDCRKYLELVLSSAPYMHTDEEFETLLPWNVDLGIVDGMKNADMQNLIREGRLLTSLPA